MDVRNKVIWIIGAAKSGLGAAKLLHKHGAKLFVSDSGKIESTIKESLFKLGIEFEEESHSIPRMIQEAELIVLSPSIPLDRPLPISALKAGIPVVSEIEVASWFTPQSALCVGITGTNGKSTTTHYAAQLFSKLGSSVACGNYGLAFSEALLDPAEHDAFIVELSSYQLETTFSFRPKVSIFLNLQNDHQARYGTLDEYLKAKWRLVLATDPSGLAIIDKDVLRRALTLGLALPQCTIAVSYGFLDQSESALVMDKLQEAKVGKDSFKIRQDPCLPRASYGILGTLPLVQLLRGPCTHAWMTTTSTEATSFKLHIVTDGPNTKTHQIDIGLPVLPGEHNQSNILAASLAALHCGLNLESIHSQWNLKSSSYTHLAHRLEEIGRDRMFKNSRGEPLKIRIINDSKATNVESTLVAVKSYPKNIRLLLGGEPKGDLYSLLIPFIGMNVCKVYPFGKAAPLICQQLSDMGPRLAAESKTLLQAAQCALDESTDGDVVLLSPACASFDEFRNFEHRGDTFRNWAMQQILN